MDKREGDRRVKREVDKVIKKGDMMIKEREI